jgi:hypothetical protein
MLLNIIKTSFLVYKVPILVIKVVTRVIKVNAYFGDKKHRKALENSLMVHNHGKTERHRRTVPLFPLFHAFHTFGSFSCG